MVSEWGLLRAATALVVRFYVAAYESANFARDSAILADSDLLELCQEILRYA